MTREERTSNCHDHDRHPRHPCWCDHWDHACPSHGQASCGKCMASPVLKVYATAEGKMKVVEVYKPFTVLSMVTKTLPSHHMATNELRSKIILLLHIGNLHWWLISHHCDTPPPRLKFLSQDLFRNRLILVHESESCVSRQQLFYAKFTSATISFPFSKNTVPLETMTYQIVLLRLR